MAQFRKKPVVIDATRLTGACYIKTLEGMMSAKAGDWVITGIEGERYACKHRIFMKTYEPVDDEAKAMVAE